MVEIWDLEKGAVVKTLKDPDVVQIRRVKYSPDGQFIAVASDRGRKRPLGDAVWIWNAISGELSDKLTHFPDTSTISMRYSADGKYISASGGYHTKIWKLQ